LIIARFAPRDVASRRIEEMHMKETRKPARKPRTPAVTGLEVKTAPAKRKTAVRKKTAEVVPPTGQPSPHDDREERVRVAAYFRAQRRGFVSGYESDDWLAAEAEVNADTPSPGGVQQPVGQRAQAKGKKA
jgi:hypothetical protein